MFNILLQIVIAWNKLLPELVMPLTLAFILLISAWLVRFRNWKTGLFAGGIALLYVASSPITMWLAITITEHRENWNDDPPEYLKYVVVPGGILSYQPGMEPEYGAMSGIDRLLSGMSLARQHSDRILYLAGGSQPGTGEPAESELMMQLITDITDFDTTRVITESESATTIEHARILDQHFQEIGENAEIILVTSARNMLRAKRTFEAHGLQVHPYATDYTPRGSFFQFPGSLIPSAAALNYNSGAVRELIGRMYYGLRDYGA